MTLGAASMNLRSELPRLRVCTILWQVLVTRLVLVLVRLHVRVAHVLILSCLRVQRFWIVSLNGVSSHSHRLTPPLPLVTLATQVVLVLRVPRLSLRVVLLLVLRLRELRRDRLTVAHKVVIP